MESQNAAIAEADAKAKAEAEAYYNDKATELRAAVDLELATFKHQLRIDTDLRKDNATKAANAAVRTVSHAHPKLPPSHRVTCSQSRTGTPSQTLTRDTSIKHPLSTTPKASPTVMASPSQALTEPLSQALRELSEPLTDITVGPPSNSFESAMMAVDTDVLTVKDSIHNPGNTAPPSPSNHSLALPSNSLRCPALGSGLDQASPPSLSPPSPPSLLDQLAALIDAKLAPIAKSIQVLTDRLDDMEDQHAYDHDIDGHESRGRPYSPSTPAPTWAPRPGEPTTFGDVTEEQVCHELIQAHRSRNDIWDLYVHVADLPPSSFESNHSGLRATHADPFSRFITLYEDFLNLVAEEPNHPVTYIASNDFVSRITARWLSHGKDAMPADPLPPPGRPNHHPQAETLGTSCTTSRPLPPRLEQNRQGKSNLLCEDHRPFDPSMSTPRPTDLVGRPL